MANALGPYYVQINYHGAQAPHTMTIPTLAWNSSQDFDTHALGTIGDSLMITNLVDSMLDMFLSDTVFDNWTVFKQLLPTDKPLPVNSGKFTGKVGTGALTGWAAAVEVQFIMRTVSFGIAKLVLLDAASSNVFFPVLTPTTEQAAVIAEWTDIGNGWCGRDNTRPNVFLKLTKNLNQKLRQEYGYT